MKFVKCRGDIYIPLVEVTKVTHNGNPHRAAIIEAKDGSQYEVYDGIMAAPTIENCIIDL